MFEIHVHHKKAKNILKQKGFDMDKRNTGAGDYQALDKDVKQKADVKGTEFDFTNDTFIVKYAKEEAVNPSLFAEYGESIEVVLVDA